MPRKRRRTVVELVHWAMGGVFGIVYGLLPEGLRQRAWSGPVYGLLVWMGFDAVIAPALGLTERDWPKGRERTVFVLDHVLFGFVLERAAVAPARMTVSMRRLRLRVGGVVQGVGFRPYVHRLATELGLDGFVRNDEHGVVIEVEGEPDAVAALLARLPAEAPPLATVELVSQEVVPARGERGFAIAGSASAGAADALVSPDVATCADCLRELFDPADRRHRYPFINCTNCGPRFTIVRGVPYDRPLTTMAGFAMCERCAAEYHDPADRRFHAQPNACPDCGPRLSHPLDRR